MTWSKAAAYGVLAVYEIAKRHRTEHSQIPFGIQAHEVARKYKLPVAYASKIMGQLARADVLHSDRGPRGGFRLNRPPEKISLWDILEAVDEFGADGRKPTAGYPPAVTNMLTKAFKDGLTQLRESYKKYSVADLL